MRIWGLCDKCNEWFRADDWFNTDVPLPTCPTCGMSPAQVRYGAKPQLSEPSSALTSSSATATRRSM